MDLGCKLKYDVSDFDLANSVKVNLGCGTRHKPGWVNLDAVERIPHVIGHDLLKPLPFAENQIGMIYASHVLEHFSHSDGLSLLQECHRVLTPGGVLRIVVPDLEAIVRNYLNCLEARRADNRLDPTDHLWSTLTMIDQLSRNLSGGDMVGFLRSRPATVLENVFRLEGSEIEELHQRLLEVSNSHSAPLGLRSGIRKIIGEAAQHARIALLRLILGARGNEYANVGKFRLSGEVHYWMYDCVSLGSTFAEAGFLDIVRRKANESYLPTWVDEHLDTEPDGRVYKPLSLFMEARKPA